jgi:hypothetical protein
VEETNTTACPECSDGHFEAFVQYGSYFTRCIACGNEGPATSWLAVAQHLSDKVRAIVVDENYKEIEFISEGVCADLYDEISSVASQGKLVFLSTPHTNA